VQLNIEFQKIMVWEWPKCHAVPEQSLVPTNFENPPPLFQLDSVDSSRPVNNRELLPLYKAMDLGA
jgi:hypothetical protein